MSLKKNFGVLILLLVILSMSTVSAEDISIDTNNTYQAPNEIQKNFTSLQTDIDNSKGVFDLAYDVKHGDDETDNYGISITKTTIINGNGHTIDANNYGGIFIVKDSSVTLTLNDLTLINANPVSTEAGIESKGGAIYFDGSTLMVNNVNFKNNTVYQRGGAIYTTGTCIVDASVFDGNDEQFRTKNDEHGGAAIYADKGATLLLSNSQITNNLKNLVIRDGNNGDLISDVVTVTGYTKISKSYFRNNSGCYGGAVTSIGYSDYGKNTIVIEDSVFDANRAFQGVAVNVIGSIFKISGTNFTNNVGLGYGSGNLNIGALLTWYGCEGTVSKCVFINNTADVGGAYSVGTRGSAIVSNCTFINNTAKRGEAIDSSDNPFDLTIKESTFTNNGIYNNINLNLNIKNFTDLQNAINLVTGILTLNGNVVMSDDEADRFKDGVTISKDITIDGKGFTINANNLGRIFNIAKDVSVTLNNVTLTNGKTTADGGAIYNEGKLTITDAKLNDNTAGSYGGAVFNNGDLIVDNSVFDANDITKRGSASVDYGGAAIYNWYSGTLSVSNSNFTNNIKNYKNGDRLVGAISTIGDATIKGSYFANNSGRWGGAISSTGELLVGDAVNTLTVSDTIFKENGGLYGSGIFVWGSNYDISDSVFDKNSAYGKGDMSPNNNNGAAIVVTTSNKDFTGAITGSNFTNNKAHYGGAVWINKGPLTIKDSLFLNNTADAVAGAVGISGKSVVVEVINSNFTNNTAKDKGGAIYNSGNLNVRETTFVNNTPEDIYNDNIIDLGIKTFTDLQNAINSVSGVLTLNQNIAITDDEASTFKDGITINKDITIDGKGFTVDARELGRIFNIAKDVSVTLNNVTLTNGKANEGGAIYNYGGANFTLIDSWFVNNSAVYGGAIYNYGSDFTIRDSWFVNNSADYGGAIAKSGGNFTIEGSNFVNNSAILLAGAIYNYGSNFTISDSDFVDNSANSIGGAIYNDEANASIENSSFRDNSANSMGGAIFNGANAILNISTTEFENNTAPNGVIYNLGTLNFNIKTFTELQAAINIFDGKITLDSNVTMTDWESAKFVNGIRVNKNITIEGNGFTIDARNLGRIFNIPDNMALNLYNVTLTNGKANMGGAINNKGNLTLKDAKLNNNTATDYGGAVFNNGDLIVDNSVFDANDITKRGSASVDYGGAAIYNWYSGTLSVSNSNFTNNIKNYKNGDRLVGAISTIGDATIKGSYFANNSGRWGGAISSTGELLVGDAVNTLTVSDTIFKENGGLYGSGIFVWGSNYDISDSVFDKNSAYGKGDMSPNNNNGAAIVVTTSNKDFTGAITGSNFTNNKAHYGGAVWINKGPLTIKDSLFLNNTADAVAGAVGISGKSVVVEVINSNFTNNTAKDKGGAIYNSGNLNVRETTFDSNKADIGDVIYNENGGIINVLLLNNYLGLGDNAPIYNNGEISPETTIVVLDNKTVYTVYNKTVPLTALIYIDGVLVAGKNLVFEIEGESYKATSLLNGTYIAQYNAISVGEKIVSATYDGASDLIIKTGILNVAKSPITLDVEANDINVGDLQIITVTVPKDATGLITLTINGENQTVSIYNGTAVFYYPNLVAGPYDVFVNYTGDKNYLANTTTAKFNVNKLEPTLNLKVYGTLIYGDNGVIIATLPSDVNDEKLTINVSGRGYTVDIVNGVATLELPKLDVNTYKITAIYTGNDKYLRGEANISIDITKADAALNVIIGDVDYGKVFTIAATLTGVNNVPLSGSVTVNVAGKNYTVVITDGKGTVNGKLPAGDYLFTASWDGDDNYNVAGDSGSFKVNKLDSAIGVVVNDINVGEDAIITVVLVSDATGSVNVTVDGKSYPGSVVNGKATVLVPNLKEGTYTVVVKYSGDNNYNDAVADTNFTVSKVGSTMDVTIGDIVFGDDLTVEAVLPADAAGDVIISVDGVNYTVPIVGGKVTKSIEGLDAGNYAVVVKYMGSDKYAPIEVIKTVNVAKAKAILDVSVANVDYGDVFTIKAMLTGVNSAKLTGDVIVNVGGKNYVVTISNGEGTLAGDKLAAANYSFTATWVGNDNYNAVNDSGKFDVNKIDSTLIVNVKDISVGEDALIEVILPNDITGVAVISVGDMVYNVTIVNGRGSETISGLGENTYVVNVEHPGDNNYNSIKGNKSFVVSKITPKLDVTVQDIVFGDDAIVNIVLPDDVNDKVVFIVDGVTRDVTVVNGRATEVVKDLNASSHNITVKYADSKKYNTVEVTKIINVDKADAALNVIIGDVDYGKVFTIAATLTGVNNVPLSGSVTVNVAGKNYTVVITDGKGTVNGKLPAGDYLFTASWDGDDNYNVAGDSGSFKVNKLDSAIGVVVNDINVGEDAIITVVLVSDATGSVNVTVDGKSYPGSVVNGKATVLVPNLKEGTYTVVVKYSGDNNYNDAVADTNFTVSKVSDYEMNITIPEIKEKVNSTISIDLPKDATGTITVEIDGKKHNANVTNGTAKVNIPGLATGEYNITITYSGDDKYAPMTKKGNITVIPNVNVILDVDDVVMTYKDGTRLVAKLTDIQGIPIANAIIYFNINGMIYNRTTDVTGSASMALNLESGVYPTTVTYNGSEVYSKVSKNITVTIKPSIEADNLVKMYQNDTHFYAKFLDKQGKVLANNTVKFNINGVFYERKTNESGVARLAINLRPGEYILTAINPVTDEQKGFNVTVRSLIEAHDLTKYYMNASKFQATIYDKNGSLAVNKTVTFNINGVFYNRTSDENGVVRLAINLRPGNYTITSMYEGLDLGNNVNVLPTLITHDLNMKYRDGSNFTAKTLDGEGNPLPNQNITFNVNGVFYYKTTGEDGIASLAINLMSGKYIITSYWDDFQIGNNIIIS